MTIQTTKIKNMDRNTTIMSLFGKGMFLCIGFVLLSQVLCAAQIALSKSDQQISNQPLITVDFHHEPLAQVLHAIAQKVHAGLSYKTKAIPSKRITYHAKKAPVYSVLNNVLKGTGLYYTLSDNHKVILIKELHLKAVKQQTVKGTVTDAETGDPLAGVNILVVGTSTGAATDSKGHYSVSVPSLQDSLRFSFIGYQTRMVSINERTSIDVALKPTIYSGQQMVVIGYGEQKEKNLTGSIGSINSKEFIKGGVKTNAFELMAGKIAGVHIAKVNTEPGSKMNIRIRGAGNINGSNSALIVVDGVPVSSAADIDPSNIKSIQVLKDASSAAIYGTRAANGVVLITTKEGQQGPTKITYNTSWAYQTPAKKLDLLNATQYMHYLNDINKDLGGPLPFTNEQIEKAGVGTNWQDELLRNSWAMTQGLSISGGNEKTNYYTSLRYLNQNGILINSGYKNYNLLLKLNGTPTNKFQYGVKINGDLGIKNKIADESTTGSENADPLNAATQFDPTLPIGKNKNGEYYRNATIALDNPLALANGYKYAHNDNRIRANVFGKYNILKNLNVTLRLGGHIANGRQNHYTSTITQRGEASGGIANITSTENTYWLSEGLIKYNKDVGQNHISLLGGATWEKFINLSQYSHTTGLLSNVTKTNLLESGDVNTMRVKSSKFTHKLQSYFARLQYSYKDKYLLTASFRRDGTSRFSKKNKYAYFPSVAAAWRITNEPFMKGDSFISDLKLRLSYGQTGSESIGNFETLLTYVAGGNTVLGEQIVNGAQPARLVNKDLKWETTNEYDVGLDFGFVENRLKGTLDYYIKDTRDQLFNKPVPMTTGFTHIRTNFGSVRNSGFEFSLTSHNLEGKLSWTTHLTFTTLKNKVTKLPSFVGRILGGNVIANIPSYAIVKEGFPMWSYYGYKVTGIFQKGDDIKDSPQPDAKSGWPVFWDKDGNGKITANDRTILGNPFPKFSYSFKNTLYYKNFNLSMYWIGVQGVQIFNGNIVESMFPINLNRNIISRYYFDRWTPENTATKYPSGVNYGTYFGNGKMINSYSVQNASYLRLKNVTLSYQIPLNSQHIFRSIQVSISGGNLVTFTKYIGYNVEGNQNSGVTKSSYNNYPVARTVSFGAKIAF
jgi:TonB-linked SusC/RagA family outer membrane protein